jgi:hypothetical protein
MLPQGRDHCKELLREISTPVENSVDETLKRRTCKPGTWGALKPLAQFRSVPAAGHRIAVRRKATHEVGYAERTTAKQMLRRFRSRHRIVPETLGGDAGYGAGAFLRTIEDDFAITPHVPISAERVAAEDADGDARRRMLRRMETLGDRISQKARKKVEPIFGW